MDFPVGGPPMKTMGRKFGTPAAGYAMSNRDEQQGQSHGDHESLMFL
jgi:hypothetical protein